MDAGFLKTQEHRRSRNLGDQIYDLTAWSLPLMFNLEVVRCGSIKAAALVPFDSTQKLQPQLSNPNPQVAYLVPWGDMAAGRFLTHGLHMGLNIKSSDLPFTLNNTAYPAGTLIIEVKQNKTDLAKQIDKLAGDTGAIVTGVDSSWVTEGPNFGSNKVVQMIAPKIAMAWDNPTSSLSAGNSRFVIESQLGYPVTAIRSSHLNVADLNHYDVLVLPSGNYQHTFNQAGIDNITTWVNRGGVLVTFGAATTYALGEKPGWLAVKKELAHQEEQDPVEPPTDKTDDPSTRKGQLFKDENDLIHAIKSEQKSPDSVSGVLARIAVDQDHWLTAGVKPEVIGMVAGNQIMSPIKLDHGKNVASFKGPDELLASGYLWQENRQQLASKPFLIHQPTGKGMVIAYTQEPTLRAFLDGLHVMLTNTLFRSVAHSGLLR